MLLCQVDGFMPSEVEEVTPEEAIQAIYTYFHTGTFEYFQIRKKILKYSHGVHVKLAKNEYIEVVSRGREHLRVWKLSKKALEVIGK